MTAAPASPSPACPACRQLDATQKVSAILDSHTNTTTGYGLVGLGNGTFGTVATSSTSRTPLARKLAPPANPRTRRAIQTFVFLLVLGIAIAATGKFTFIEADSIRPFLAPADSAKITSFLLVAGPFVMLLAVIPLRIVWEVISLPARRVRYRSWLAMMGVWRSLYYCSRNGIVFAPGSAAGVPPEQLGTLLSTAPRPGAGRQWRFARLSWYLPLSLVVILTASGVLVGSVTVAQSNLPRQAWYDANVNDYVWGPWVADGNLYVMGGGGTSDTLLHALDPRTGALKWTYDPAASMSIIVGSGSVYGSENSGTSEGGGATGEAIVAISATDGAARWTYTDNNPLVSTQIGGTILPAFATAGNLVVAALGVAPNVKLDALNATTGKLIWSVPLPYVVSVLAVDISGGTVHALAGQAGMIAFDAVSGRQLWRNENASVPDNQGAAVPEDTQGYVTTADGVVYSGTIGNYLPTVGSPSITAGSIIAIDAHTGHRLWANTTSLTQPTIAGSLVYIYKASGQVLALNAKTGTTVWAGPSQRSPDLSIPNGCGTEAAVASQPLVTNGVVFTTGTDLTGTNATALSAANGSVLWSVPNQSVVGLTRSVLYTTDGAYLYAHNPSTGAVRWEYPGICEGGVEGVGNLYATTNTSDVVAIHLPPDSLP